MQKHRTDPFSQKINILKGLAIIAVILIHILNAFLSHNGVRLDQARFVLVTDQVVRFCVPLFVGLSGFTLALSYGERKFEWRYYFKRRVMRLLPQYIFWSVILSIYLNAFAYWRERTEHFPLWEQLLLGRADYHLYFVPMIVQLYLLFPLILFLLKKYATLSLVASFVLQVLMFLFIAQHTEKPGFDNNWSDQKQYVLFLSWQFYFVLGAYLAKYKEKLLTLSSNRSYLIAFLITVTLGYEVWNA